LAESKAQSQGKAMTIRVKRAKQNECLLTTRGKVLYFKKRGQTGRGVWVAGGGTSNAKGGLWFMKKVGPEREGTRPKGKRITKLLGGGGNC